MTTLNTITTLAVFTKDNYPNQLTLLCSEIERLDILGAIDADYQHNINGLTEAIGIRTERVSLHTRVHKDPDSENINDINTYKIMDIKRNKYKERMLKEATLKLQIFQALTLAHQGNLFLEFNVSKHHYLTLTQMFKFLATTFGITTQIERRKQQKEVLPTLPIPQEQENGTDMIIKINAILNQFKQKHLLSKTKKEQDNYLHDIVLDAVDNTPQIKKNFYAHVNYGESYQEVCNTLVECYKNIEMSDEIKSASAASRTNNDRSRSKSRERGRNNSRSTSRERSNYKTGKANSPRRSASPDSRHCDFHGDCNHTTDMCFEFKKIVIKNKKIVDKWISERVKTSYAADSNYDDDES